MQNGPKVRGIGRVGDNAQALLIALDRVPSDAEIRAIHDRLTAAPVVLPNARVVQVRDCACCCDQPTVPPDCPACKGVGGFRKILIGAAN